MQTGHRKVILLALLFCAATITIQSAILHWERVGPFPPGTTTLNGVRFGGDKFVAWGDNILVYTTNGTVWRQGENYAPAAQFKGVAYGNGRFVAVTGSGYATASKDGVHWSTELVSSVDSFADVAFGGGLFVAVGPKGFLASSADGVTWNVQRDATSKDLALIAYGNGRFVAHARAADGRTSNGFVVSTDGTHWIDVPAAPLYTLMDCQTPGCKTATYVGGLAFFEGKFVLVALTTLSAGSFNTFLRSDDGVTWSTGEQTQAPSTLGINSLTTANTLLVPPNVAFGNGTFVKVDYNLWYGVDPYQMARVPMSMSHPMSVAAHGDVIVGVGPVEHLLTTYPTEFDMIVSTDGGITYRQIPAPPGAKGLASVRYANGKFVAVGAEGTIVTSSDGVNWSKVQSNTTEKLYDLVYGGGKWYVVGTHGQLLTSDDAISFTARTLDANYNLISIAYGDGKLVAVAPGAGLLASTNGIDWGLSGTNLFGAARAVAYGNGKFVVVGFISAISTDGFDWTVNGSGGGSGTRVAYANGLFVSERNYPGAAQISRDGVHWELVSVDPTTFLYGTDASDGRLWASGNMGAIWRAVFNPQVTGSVNASGKFQLSIDVSEPGAYRVMTSTTGAVGSWTPLDLLDISSHADWTSGAAVTGNQFFQVRKE